MNAQAQPARFDHAIQRRRAMIGKIHVYKKQLALDEDDYRQILLNETGKTSAADLDQRELDKVIRRMEGLGAKPLPKAGRKGIAQHPMAKKARALWISLYHLGAVRSASERSLEAFAKRQLGCEKLVWANQRDGYRLIEALKAMAERHGWKQTGPDGNNLDVRSLREGLCSAILGKLAEAGEVPANWTISDAAFRLCGIELGSAGPVSADGYDDLAAALGKKLRELGAVA